jgi:hypothetical protein
LASKRGRGILDFGGFLGSTPVSGSRFHPVIKPDIVRGLVYTRTSISGLVQVRLSLSGVVNTRSSIEDETRSRTSIEEEVYTRESLQGTTTTRVTKTDQQEL